MLRGGAFIGALVATLGAAAGAGAGVQAHPREYRPACAGKDHGCATLIVALYGSQSLTEPAKETGLALKSWPLRISRLTSDGRVISVRTTDEHKLLVAPGRYEVGVIRGPEGHLRVHSRERVSVSAGLTFEISLDCR